MGALVLTSFLTVLSFSGGFRWPGGLREMLLAVPQWVSRNESDVGHHKPFWYYGKMFYEQEPTILLVLVLIVACWLAFLFGLGREGSQEKASAW